MADNAKASTKQADTGSTITVPVDPDMDPATREDLIRQLAPRTAAVGVVGNLADVQRGGAHVVKGTGSMSDGVIDPPGVTAEDIAVEKKIDEAVEAAAK